jgi:hypothetical protein
MGLKEATTAGALHEAACNGGIDLNTACNI